MTRYNETLEKKVPVNKLISLSNILLATDFSPVSDRALEYALSLARRYDARIYVTHILSPDAYRMAVPEAGVGSLEKQRYEAEEEMADILKSGRLRGVPHEMVIGQGNLWPTIEELIARYEIDLVVVGTHSKGAVQRFLLGSSAEVIFRQARIPVLTVGPAAKGEAPREVAFKKILFATNFGPGAEREAAYASSLAQEHEARLTLLNVVPPAKHDPSEAGAMNREFVTHQLQELVPPETTAWCQPEYRIGVGDPVEEILKTARQMNADLIVMGAKPRKGLASHVPHTKASKVVGGAPCPVLTIKS